MKTITIKLNDLFSLWVKGIKDQLLGVTKENDIKVLKKELKKIIKLL